MSFEQRPDRSGELTHRLNASVTELLHEMQVEFPGSNTGVIIAHTSTPHAETSIVVDQGFTHAGPMYLASIGKLPWMTTALSLAEQEDISNKRI